MCSHALCNIQKHAGVVLGVRAKLAGARCARAVLVFVLACVLRVRFNLSQACTNGLGEYANVHGAQ